MNLPRPAVLRRNQLMLNVRALQLALLLASPASGFAQSPSLTHTSPGALLPGKTMALTLHGAHLAGATNLWTGFGAKVISAAAATSSATRFQLAIPATAPVGIHAVRIASVNGGSNPLMIMVDDLPSVADTGTNTSAANAQTLAWPVAVDGAAAPLGFKFYRVVVKKGDRLAIEAVARRLDSKLDPVLRLLDLKGRELAFCDDESGLGGDCRFAHTFAASGEFLIELRDINHGGGPDFYFRLRVGDFPLVSLPFPAGIQGGTKSSFEFVGPQVEKLKPVTGTAPIEAMRLALATKFPGGKSSAFASALVTHTAEFAEAEPNDTAETATPFTLPGGLNGRFLKPKDRDFWKFTAQKGQRILFTAQTRSIGSASEVTLQLRDAKGTAIANSSPNDAGEGSVTNTIPADGTYSLVVDELIRRGGPQHAYRVEAELLTPGFTLDTDTDKFEVAPGGSFSVKINAVRRNFTGPITLTVVGLSDAQLADVVINEKATNGTLKVTLTESAMPGGLTSFHIIGKARIGDGEVKVLVHTLPALKKLFPRMTSVPRELEGLLMLGVKEKR